MGWIGSDLGGDIGNFGLLLSLIGERLTLIPIFFLEKNIEGCGWDYFGHLVFIWYSSHILYMKELSWRKNNRWAAFSFVSLLVRLVLWMGHEYLIMLHAWVDHCSLHFEYPICLCFIFMHIFCTWICFLCIASWSFRSIWRRDVKLANLSLHHWFVLLCVYMKTKRLISWKQVERNAMFFWLTKA